MFKQTGDGQTTERNEFGTGAFAVSPDETLLAVEVLDVNTGKLRVELRSMADNENNKNF